MAKERKTPKERKNRAEKEARILEALGELLAEQGFVAVGVNALAKRAGVDKVLIYRYFGGLDGAMSSYAKSGDFWPSAKELLGIKELGESEANSALVEFQNQPFGQQLGCIMRRYVQGIRKRPLTLEILAWETIERNELTIALETVREEMGVEVIQYLSVEPQQAELLQSVTAIFSAAVNYLAVRARKIRTFNGIDITQDSGWDQLVTTMEAMAQALFSETELSNQDLN